MMSDPSLCCLTDQINQEHKPSHIHLFGSRLFGCSTSKSDWNFYITKGDIEREEQKNYEFQNTKINLNILPHNDFKFATKFIPLLCVLLNQSSQHSECNLLSSICLARNTFIKNAQKQAQQILNFEEVSLRRCRHSCVVLQLALLIIAQSDIGKKPPFEVDYSAVKDIYEIQDEDQLQKLNVALNKQLKNQKKEVEFIGISVNDFSWSFPQKEEDKDIYPTLLGSQAFFLSFPGEHRSQAKSLKCALIQKIEPENRSFDTVFLDEDSLPEGEKIEHIIQSVTSSHVFIALISPLFFVKPWPVKELLARKSGPTILVLINTTQDILDSCCCIKLIKQNKSFVTLNYNDTNLIDQIYSRWLEYLQTSRPTTLPTLRRETLVPVQFLIYLDSHASNGDFNNWKSLISPIISKSEKFQIVQKLDQANVVFIYHDTSCQKGIRQAIKNRKHSYEIAYWKKIQDSVTAYNRLVENSKDCSEAAMSNYSSKEWEVKRSFIPFLVIPFFKGSIDSYPPHLCYHKGCGDCFNPKNTKQFVTSFINRFEAFLKIN